MTAGFGADLARVVNDLQSFAKSVQGQAGAELMRRVGVEVVKVASEAVRDTPAGSGRSLADMSMSGWHRGRPVPLGTRVTAGVYRTLPSAVLTPDRTAGLWRVLESGRQGNAKGARVARGTTKAGAVRYRRARRTSGATEAKRTWTRAAALMEARTGPAVRKVLAENFSRTLGR